jgi:hypothetical protein
MELEHFTAFQRSKILPIEFLIQASNPRPLRAHDPDDESLSDAIQTVFPLDSEWAFLVWNGVYVPLSYKYDLSLMVDDIVWMLEEMLLRTTGNRVINWPSNTFSATWEMTWNEGVVKVSARWDCVLGGVEALLRGRPTISVRKSEFIAEWKTPLMIVEQTLRLAGYATDQVPSLMRLSAIIAKLPEKGVLYRAQARADAESA